jgi:hypothetical protein
MGNGAPTLGLEQLTTEAKDDGSRYLKKVHFIPTDNNDNHCIHTIAHAAKSLKGG